MSSWVIDETAAWLWTVVLSGTACMASWNLPGCTLHKVTLLHWGIDKLLLVARASVWGSPCSQGGRWARNVCWLDNMEISSERPGAGPCPRGWARVIFVTEREDGKSEKEAPGCWAFQWQYGCPLVSWWLMSPVYGENCESNKVVSARGHTRQLTGKTSMRGSDSSRKWQVIRLRGETNESVRGGHMSLSWWRVE